MGLVLPPPPHPPWALGTKILAESLGRVELHSALSSVSLSCAPSPQGHPLGCCPGWILSYPSAHPELPSVCLSISLWTPAPYKILAFTGTVWSQLRSRSPGPSLARWDLALSRFVLVQKEARQAREGVQGLAGVCRCPGSQHGECWEGRGATSFIVELGTRHLD